MLFGISQCDRLARAGWCVFVKLNPSWSMARNNLILVTGKGFVGLYKIQCFQFFYFKKELAVGLNRIGWPNCGFGLVFSSSAPLKISSSLDGFSLGRT